MVSVAQHSMFARAQAVDERIEVGMSERDVRAPEGGHDLDAGFLEVGTSEDGDGARPFQTGLAQHVDFVVIGGQESRDAVSVPPWIATPKPNCIGC